MAETIRAGIQAVPKGQIEAARRWACRRPATMVSIVIPQAFRIILPPLTNELILLTKDSSLVSCSATPLDQYELTQFGRRGAQPVQEHDAGRGRRLCYLIITIPLSPARHGAWKRRRR